MSTPTIGITTSKTTPPDQQSAAMRQAYFDAILQAGGLPLFIPSDIPEVEWKGLYRRLDGILFSGGGDIALEHFAGQPHPEVYGVDEGRDSIELALTRCAAENGLPFLGVCRGLQMVNVAFGGTLYTHILDQAPNALDHSYENPDMLKECTHLLHSVEIQPNNHIASIFGTTQLQVNSLHHQGIKDLAPALRATAFAPDGIIEAVELTGHPFGVAVQWHPEWLTDQPATRRLFKTFVDAANAQQ